jgi:hypothetical protein
MLCGAEFYGTLVSSADRVAAEQKVEDVENKKQDTFTLSYQTGVQSGVLHHIGTVGGKEGWTNPADAGRVTCSSSGMNGDHKVERIADNQRSVKHCTSTAVEGSWMAVDLGPHRQLRVDHYFLATDYGAGKPRHWNLEGSSDGSEWTTLLQHSNDQSLDHNISYCTAHWPVPVQETGSAGDAAQYFRHLRVKLTGKNSNGGLNLMLCGVEFYGTLVSSAERRKAAEGTAHLFTGQCDGKNLGTDGIICAIGSENGTQPHANPHDKGEVEVEMSSVASWSGEPSMVVGNKGGHCSTESIPQSSVTVDFKTRRVDNIEKYVIRHGSAYDGFYRLKSWVLEASVDRKEWIVIDRQEHGSSPLPDAAYSTAAFPAGDEKLVVVKQEGGFRYVKLTQTGTDSYD